MNHIIYRTYLLRNKYFILIIDAQEAGRVPVRELKARERSFKLVKELHDAGNAPPNPLVVINNTVKEVRVLKPSGSCPVRLFPLRSRCFRLVRDDH